ncbi:MAG: site-specific integrase [Planctomycetaceae bacterium]|jgi:integrase|nr:site-specific integrase [Planctomycetaceae bacterium]MBT6483438.1 site-specific integrase [Planctomycetaceae bacterium]MBT6493888.1 site-specific integrase [Planctomycetaceae bacterium]
MAEEIKVHVVDYGKQRNLMARYVDPLTGKHVSKSTGTRRRKDADRFAAKWEHDLREGRFKSTLKVTWNEFRQRYEDEKLSGLSDNYAQTMNATLNHFEKLRIRRLAKVDARALSQFQAMLRGTDVKESTIRCYLKHLRAALGWAHEIGLLSEIPKFTMPKRGRTTSKMKGRPITLEEFERMLDVVPSVRPTDAADWLHYLTGLWLSGLRLDESLILSWDVDADVTVDLSGRHPRFRFWAEGQKRHKDELLPMTPDFAEWLLRTPESERVGRIFQLRGRKGYLTTNTVGRKVSQIGRAANVVVDKSEDQFATCHDLRRSFGTRWSRRVKPATLQLLMRHADIKTTMAYYVAQDTDDVSDELWQEHAKSGVSGNNPGNTLHAGPQPQSPQDVVTSHGQMSSKVGTTGFEPATS